MTSSEQHKSSVSAAREPAPQRPKTLFQRLSSGIVHVLPPLRSVTPKNELNACPSPASNISRHKREEEAVAESEQVLATQTEDGSNPSPTPPCPHDPNTYHSFASIEKRRCSLCGMRGPKIVLNEPCEACRTGGPGSHIPSGRSQVDHGRRHSATDPRQLARLDNSSSMSLLGPRSVTPERAAKRIGNPPRVSRLPRGIIRLPVTEAPPQNATRTSSTSLETTIFGHHSHTGFINNSSKARSVKKPESPKLHHIHGLPQSENFPFVHKHEIPKHAIALRAGSTSPLTDLSRSPRSSPTTSGPRDYSDTVHYGGDRPPLCADRATVLQPQITTVVVKEVRDDSNAMVDLQASPLDTLLAGSQVYRKHSPQHPPPSASRQEVNDATDSSTTFGSQDTTSIRLGQVRLELKGGDSSSKSLPKLRGGSGHKETWMSSLSFKLKRWLLTCHGPCPDDFDTDSDADLPPARVVSPLRAQHLRQKTNGRASLPAHLCKQITSTRTTNKDQGTEALPAPRRPAATISNPSSRPGSPLLSINVPVKSPALPSHCPEPPLPHPPLLTPTQVLNPPFPHLRGGGSPSPSLPSEDRVPPTLFFLAGATGRKRISWGGWRQRRPEKRMGGLLGMAVFGRRYGMGYRSEMEVEGEREGCEVGSEGVVDGGGSGEGGQGGAGELVPPTPIVSSAEPAGAEMVKEGAVSVAEVRPATDAESVQRAPTTPLPDPVNDDEVPLCSGALPVEPERTSQHSNPPLAASVIDSQASNDGDVVVVKEGEP